MYHVTSLLRSLAIELIFVTLRRGFKKAGSVLFDISDTWDKDFLNPITSVHICIAGWCYGCVYILYYNLKSIYLLQILYLILPDLRWGKSLFDAFAGGQRKSLQSVLVRSRSRSNCFAHDGQRDLRDNIDIQMQTTWDHIPTGLQMTSSPVHLPFFWHILLLVPAVILKPLSQLNIVMSPSRWPFSVISPLTGSCSLLHSKRNQSIK